MAKNRQTLSLVVATEDGASLKLIPSIHVSPNTLSSLHPLQTWLPWLVQEIPDALIIFIQSLKRHHWHNEDQHAPSATSFRPFKGTDIRKSTLKRTQKTVPNGAGNTVFPLCAFICRVLTWEEFPSASHPVLDAPASFLRYLVIVVCAESTALGQALAASASSLRIWKALAAFSLACVCENVVTADSSVKAEIMSPAGPEASFALRHFKNSISLGSKGCTVFWNPITNTWGFLSSGGLSCGINPQWMWTPSSCFHIVSTGFRGQKFPWQIRGNKVFCLRARYWVSSSIITRSSSLWQEGNSESLRLLTLLMPFAYQTSRLYLL